MQFLKKNGIQKFNNSSSIYELEQFNDNIIYIMRDDLIPFSFGGNKARKAYNFFEKIINDKYNYVITYGSASSNHCRIIANMAKTYGLSCTIISTESEKTTNNKIICEMLNVEFVYCKIDDVKNTIEKQILEKKNLGFKPYFIQGGGHGNLGTKAYVDAFQDILGYEKTNDLKFDYIFHASGTGTTQAGLIIGKLINKSSANIVGISIARKLPRGKEVVIESVKDYIEEFKIKEEFKEIDVNFVDSFILNGYGDYNEEILNEIKNMMCYYGIPMDTTYVGKAYWGMKQFIKSNNLQNKKILFIHTGGTPLFFDKIKELK